ncbi:hypothetical protein SDC9_173160 [bioreactor metagenome]|uniref:Uncharacterized protein n=1 Tax=bioreactor metagenome TaxID=1076179 RepID=A0A645GGE1_9ZZZZ
MLSKPAFVVCKHGCNAQGQALLSKQGVPAVARTVGPDFTGLREVGDVLIFKGSAGPFAVVTLTLSKRLADAVETGDILAIGAEDIKDLQTNAGHDHHVDDNVCTIGQFNTNLGDRAADRTHGERNDIECAAFHATTVEAGHGLLECDGIDPVIGRTCSFLALGGDVGSVLDACYV